MIGVCDLRHLFLNWVQPLTAFINCTFTICHNNILKAHGNKKFNNRNSSCSRSGSNDLNVFDFLPTTFSALITPASVITAVPCWSSWKIGISQHSFSFFSISKHLGAEISSRFTPPKLPARRRTVCTISSTSLLRTQSGIASTSPNSLNRTHLPP